MRGQREVEGERKRVEVNHKMICMDRLSGLDVCGSAFEAVRPDSEEKCVGNSLDLILCVLASLPVVPVVTVPFSDVNLVCEVVFSVSDRELVESQTFCRGWLSSGSSSAGGGERDNPDQEGTANPASSSGSLHSQTAWKQ